MGRKPAALAGGIVVEEEADLAFALGQGAVSGERQTRALFANDAKRGGEARGEGARGGFASVIAPVVDHEDLPGSRPGLGRQALERVDEVVLSVARTNRDCHRSCAHASPSRKAAPS